MLNKYVTIKNILILTLCLVTQLLHAAELIASISSNQVDVGQRVILNLTLHDAKAHESPDLSALIRDFTIYSQQQYSSYSNYNGTVTSETGWDITLLPKIDGELIIPILEVNTNKGPLRSKEIKIHVQQPGNGSPTANPNATDTLGVSFIAHVNKSSAYVKEPIIYTLKIISYRSLINVTLEDIKATDAIIDKIGQPKQYEKILGGVRAHIIELTYYVTPLTPGKIVITPAIIRGEVQEAPQRHNLFFNSASYSPFELRSDKISLTAMAPAIKNKDWLPLQDLHLSEEWQGLDKAKVGDTIIRKIKQTATGGFSNQLPSAQEFVEVAGFKTYVDKPVLNDQVLQNNEVLSATKEESFSLVPLQPGKITLPAVKISWWNVKTKKLEVSTLPAKIINVLPSGMMGHKDATIDYSQIADQAVPSVASSYSLWLYILIASLILVIVSMFAVIIYLLRKKNTPVVKKASHKPSNKEFTITTAADLRKFILRHAIKSWRAPKDLTLNKLGTFLTEHNYVYNLEQYIILCKNINSAIYTSNNIDLAVLLELWEQFRGTVIKSDSTKIEQSTTDYINLNPT